MKLRNLLSVSALLCIVGCALAYIHALPIRLGPPADRTSLSMSVADTNGLVVGSKVLLRGTPVGEVVALTPSAAGADVAFYVDDQYPIPVDTEIRLDNLSALGETYIGLLPRTANGPMFEQNAHIDTEQVTQPPTIAALSASLVHLFEQVDPAELDRIVTQTGIALGDGSSLPNLERASELLAQEMANRPGKGRELLTNLQNLLDNAGFVGPDIAAAGPDLVEVGEAYNSLIDDSAITLLRRTGSPESLIDFGKYLARIQQFLDRSAPDIETLASALLPGFTRIASAAEQLDSSRILESALAGISDDGTVTVNVAVPQP